MIQTFLHLSFKSVNEHLFLDIENIPKLIKITFKHTLKNIIK